MIHGCRHRLVRSVLWLALISMVGAPVAAQPPRTAPATQPPPVAPAQPPATFVCPMHAAVQSDTPGKCPVCGMALVSSAPAAAVPYQVDIKTSPASVVPGRPFELHVVVREPRTKAIVTEFTEVHEKRFHMFVVSHDLQHYDHVHPEQRPDGSWSLEVAVPRAGLYKIYSDFLPRGGTPQMIARTLMTAGSTVDPVAAEARLTPDAEMSHIADTMSVTLHLPAAGLVAGREETLTYRITDAVTGEPVNDIEPYLGAWGHSLLISEDTSHVVHAHPAEHVHAGAGAAGGGPTITFKVVLPEPGNYRIWTQIKRGGEVSTAVFTVAVASPSTR